MHVSTPMALAHLVSLKSLLQGTVTTDTGKCYSVVSVLVCTIYTTKRFWHF